MTYPRLSVGKVLLIVQASCPGQRFRDGARKIARFRIRA